jgi:saccharopine dehydrogenase-like NADP-dependent oxidoreductase
MPRVLVLGAGKIGSLVACLLSQQGSYDIHLGDVTLDAPKHLVEDLGLSRVTPAVLDVREQEAVDTYLSAHPVDAIISSLPYFCNPTVAKLALKHGCHYFDLTEDVEVTDQIRTMAEGATHAFMPQCGLAPGFISVVTHDLMTHFETLDHVKMRVGALPLHPSNALKYSLTWSTDGLINEYGNLCYGIEEGRKIPLQPLEGYETIELDGLLYEAYKTLRYPGHCEKIQLLMKDLRLNEDRKTLKRVLEHAIPQTLQDVVLIYASVTGTKQGEFFEESYVKKVYPQCIKGKLWSAIQVTTASSVCCVMDLVLRHPRAPGGFVTQESILLKDFLANDFGVYYR